VLLAELGKTERFEVVTADADTLRRQTGRTDWTGAEILPADFFDSLQRTYGCDAILFCELTVYHPYPPEIIGWRLKLVDARTRQILWAVDKEFAADQAAVAQDARRYLAAQHPTALDTPDVREVWLMEHSPRRFAQFTAARVLATLPTRAAKSESNR
jgi:hypothetical protein